MVVLNWYSWAQPRGGRNSEVARISGTLGLIFTFWRHFLYDLGVKGQRSSSNLIGIHGCRPGLKKFRSWAHFGDARAKFH